MKFQNYVAGRTKFDFIDSCRYSAQAVQKFVEVELYEDLFIVLC